MTLQASVGYKLPKYVKVYAPTLKRETLKPFSEVSPKGDIKVYTVLHEHDMLFETLGTVVIGEIKTSEYITPSAVKLESIYSALFPKLISQQPMERSELRRESLSTLKPEIVGLGLGGIVSFGFGIFALATHNTGIATVMAGPFLASILGFALLLIGIKRKKQ